MEACLEMTMEVCLETKNETNKECLFLWIFQSIMHIVL